MSNYRRDMIAAYSHPQLRVWDIGESPNTTHRVGSHCWKSIVSPVPQTNDVYLLDMDSLLYGINLQNNTTTKISDKQWKDVSIYGAALGIDLNGHLYAWGDNSYGQLGLGDTEVRSTPTQVGTDTWQSIAIYYNTVVGVKSNGYVYSWGKVYGWLSGLGDPDEIDVNYHSTPQLVTTSKCKKIIMGSDRAFLITESGTVMAWGENFYGQTGVGKIINNVGSLETILYRPMTVPDISNVRDIKISGGSTFFLTTGGSCYACGKNNFGQLGLDNTNETIYHPERSRSYDEISTNITDSDTDLTILFYSNTHKRLYQGGSNVSEPPIICTGLQWTDLNIEGGRCYGISNALVY